MELFKPLKKISWLIILSSIILVAGKTASGQMRQIYLDNQEDNEINKISFYSPSTGFVAFSDWIGFTTDSGRTFTRKYITINNVDFNGYNVNLLFGFWIKGLKAFDQNNIIAYGNYGLVPAILSSSDGGNTFKLVYHFQYAFYASNGIADMVFPQNDNIGYAVDVDQILKTTDKGKSWFPVYTSPNSVFDHLVAVDNNNVFAISDDNTSDILSSNGKPFINNKILKTANGGSSWQKVNTPSGSIINAFFLTSNKGWLNIDNDLDNDFYYTSNGGTNWTQKNKSEITPFYGSLFKFINDSTGFALSGFDVIKTTDSGSVWEPIPRDNNYSYLGYGNNDLQVLNSNQLWAGGGHGFLQINTNADAAPLPKAYFAIDTSGVDNTSVVKLINFSKKNYHYKWYVNNKLIRTDYNASYSHQLSDQADSIKLIVTNGAYSDTTVKYQYFMVPDLPVITSFSPVAGSTGTSVTINGSGFTNVSSVKFGGIPASSFTIVSDTKIIAIVGNGASGEVETTDKHGTFALSGFSYFPPNVQPPPVITGITNPSGPVGTKVTITGNNFGTSTVNNIVYFGATKANLISATSSQITCTVPAGASFDQVSVLNTTNHKTGQSLKPFNVTFADSSNFTPSSFLIGEKLMFRNEYYSAKEIRGKDIDGDGKPDLVTVIENIGDSICVYRNTTTGNNFSFEPRVNIGFVPALGSGKFDINDLDGDGRPDIAAATNEGNIAVIRNNSTPGTISFDNQIMLPTAEGTLQTIISDLDNDGKNDIVAAAFNASRVSIIRNTSVPGFLSFGQTMNLVSGGNTSEVAVGDLDGDGKKEIVAYNYLSSASNNRSSFSYFKNKSTPGNILLDDKVDIPVVGIALNAVNIDLVDYDNDNKLDVIIVNSNNFAFFRNTSTPGNITFEPVVYVPFPVLANAGVVSNLNGDSKPDIAIGLSNGKISLYGNASEVGNLKHENPDQIPSTHLLHLNAADFNMDGKIDLAYGSLSSPVHSIIILKNNIGIPDTFSVCSNSNTFITSDITGSKYQWQLNKGNGYFDMVDSVHASGTKTNELNLIHVPLSWNGYKFRCIVDRNYSTESVMYLKPVIVPSVSISASDTTTCLGSSVTFKAKVINPGMNPYYQWQVNGEVVSAGSDEFITNRLRNNDSVWVIFSNDQGCNYSPSDTSRIIIMKVNETAPSISISTPQTAVCEGAPVTFTAITDGSPTKYQWKVNGYIVSSNPVLTVTSLKNGDIIYLDASFVNSCGAVKVVTSNAITMTVNSVSPSVSVTSSTTNICSGDNATFTANPVNGGASPHFQWKNNGLPVGDDKINYTTDSLKNGDVISVTLISNAACAVSDPVSSNELTITVNPLVKPAISIQGNTTILLDSSTTISSTIANGGSSPGYQWQDSTSTHSWMNISNEINSSVKYFPSATGDKIRCILTGNAACATDLSVTSKALSFIIKPTVPREDEIAKVYPNPVSTLLTIDSLKLDKGWETLQVISINGSKNIMMRNIKGLSKVTIDVAALEKGTYIIILKGQQGNAAYLKFMKM